MNAFHRQLSWTIVRIILDFLQECPLLEETLITRLIEGCVFHTLNRRFLFNDRRHHVSGRLLYYNRHGMHHDMAFVKWHGRTLLYASHLAHQMSTTYVVAGEGVHWFLFPCSFFSRSCFASPKRRGWADGKRSHVLIVCTLSKIPFVVDCLWKKWNWPFYCNSQAGFDLEKKRTFF